MVIVNFTGNIWNQYVIISQRRSVSTYIIVYRRSARFWRYGNSLHIHNILIWMHFTWIGNWINNIGNFIASKNIVSHFIWYEDGRRELSSGLHINHIWGWPWVHVHLLWKAYILWTTMMRQWQWWIGNDWTTRLVCWMIGRRWIEIRCSTDIFL